LKKDIQNLKDHIVFLGEAGFPLGLGAVQRMSLVAKALLYDGYKVTVICRKGVWKKNGQIHYGEKGNFEGIDYVYTSKGVFRPKEFIHRNIQKLKGMVGEFKYLYRLKKSNKLTAAIISNHSALHVFRYRIYSLLIGFPVILNFVELASSMKGRDSLSTKFNDYIFDNFIVKIVDGALPISDKLMDYYRDLSPSKPSLKLPILCDFEKFNPAMTSTKGITFLYCGAASYMELITFVIDAFDQLKNLQENTILQLILGGKDGELNKVKQKIEQAHNKDYIRLITNVPHHNIPEYFAKAAALLIPLRPSVQDEARFPHKIGEYLAAGRPMITTAYGEINNYNFLNGETALVADTYDVQSFAEKMKYVLENPLKAKEIGIKGRQMGLDNFDYRKHGRPLRNYFSILNQK